MNAVKSPSLEEFTPYEIHNIKLPGRQLNQKEIIIPSLPAYVPIVAPI